MGSVLSGERVAHPRVSGDVACPSVMACGTPGSPPRERGRLAVALTLGVLAGLTPA